MYATAVFQFRQSDNGWLMSEFAFMRGLFLIFLFPPIINNGRRWYLTRYPEEAGRSPEESQRADTVLEDEIPTRPEQFEAPVGTYADDEPVAPDPAKEDEGTGFDLFFLRWSLVLDGLLTMLAAFATKSWHIYLGKAQSLDANQRRADPGSKLPFCSPLPRGLRPPQKGS